MTDIDDYRFVYRLASAVSTAYTPNNLNQYTAVGSTSPTYDSNGNLTSNGTNTYTYDAQNRLVAAVTPDHTATYTYDPMGRRIEKEVDGTTTQYLHDNDQVIVEYNASGTELRRYIYGPGIDEPICMITDSTTYYYHFDGLGSVVGLSDATGALQEIYAYTVFGQPNGTSYLGNPYLFTGREYDPETGLYYYRARFYDSSLGRFLQPDPIGYDDGMNLYAYCLNDPLNFIDAEGLSHIGFIKLLSRMADKGVKKTIKSLEKQIAKHEEAILDPAQRLAKQHHEHELRVFKTQLDLANKEAAKRGLMGGIAGLIGGLLDPFDAISGELSSDDILYPNGFPTSTNCP